MASNSTTESRAATNDPQGKAPVPSGPTVCPGAGERFTLSPGLNRGAETRPHDRRRHEPLYRPLRIYTVDPGTRLEDGAITVANVPYEPLTVDQSTGIRGAVFHVMPIPEQPSGQNGRELKLSLDDHTLLLQDGHAPSPVAPGFHQQMVYAVASLVYDSFRRALGRHLTWGFDRQADEKPANGAGSGGTRLRLHPHGRPDDAGASYDAGGGKVIFGFLKTPEKTRGRGVPGGQTFSCVSHDIVTHEVTHALLDGLRAYFLEPTSAEVVAFHEGFADVISLLHHFSYPEVLRAAIRHSHGHVERSKVLTSMGIEFGLETGTGGAIRTLAAVLHGIRHRQRHAYGEDDLALGEEGTPEVPLGVVYSEGMEAHDMGRALVSAVFNAFATVYARKVERYMRLASGGTGVLPWGDLSSDLQDVLVEEAGQIAKQFLNMCIRAIDYCPPVDLQLGDFLRAVITADGDLVPDDPWGYREAWIDAFATHRIYPRGVQSMSEDELRWPSAEGAAPPEENLAFSKLQFSGDPACAPEVPELQRRACALGNFVAAHPDVFGILSDGNARLAPDGDETRPGDKVSLPEVQSVRTARRIGPDGQVLFDLVAEVTQTRFVKESDDEAIPFLFRGGATIILGPKGELRYVIAKGVGENSRLFRQKKFMGGAGSGYVTTTVDGTWKQSDATTLQFFRPRGTPSTGSVEAPAKDTGTASS